MKHNLCTEHTHTSLVPKRIITVCLTGLLNIIFQSPFIPHNIMIIAEISTIKTVTFKSRQLWTVNRLKK